ncbi:uncharacterized protein PSANT_06753 [Moesziomyces antarcticus]|nr:uncharacterized protein PSANT_06753 [Moesziomyces antarcticus]
MASEAPSGLAVAGEVMPEASTSALPASSTTEHATVTSQEPLYDALHEAKQSLDSQTKAAAHIHPLNATTQSLYSASSADGRLSRDDYRQLISQIRRSVSQFAATTPALKAPASAPSDVSQPNDAAAANQLRRYISLLAETSTHTTALAHSIAPFKAQRDPASSTNGLLGSSLAFPPSLQAGTFRKGESAAPPSSWTDALQTLEALCSTLEHTASKLGLETFSDPAPEVADEPTASGSTGVLTRTLTLGAKILVIDVEFLLEGSSSAASLRPRIKLKLSYATDSADSQHVRDPRLGLVLETDIQKIADKLFGNDGPGAIEQDRTAVAQALAKWTTNLTDLLALDALEARATEASADRARSTDLFAAMQDFCSAVVRVSEAESSSSNPDAVLDRGHGLHQLHADKPFLHTVFARDATSGQEYTLSLGVQALDLPSADSGHARSVQPSFSLTPQAEELLLSSSAKDPATSLGSVPSPANAEKRVPLHFVVRLSPPVVVTRPTAAKLATICNLKETTPSGNTAAAPAIASAGATWFEDVLASSWAERLKQSPMQDDEKPRRCIFTLAQTVESVRSAQSQGLVVDSLPLLTSTNAAGDGTDGTGVASQATSTLARLFAAIEILRDEVKVTELMHAAVATKPDEPAQADAKANGSAELSLDDLLGSATGSTPTRIPVTLAFRVPIANAAEEARQTLSLQLAFRTPTDDGSTVNFDASISPSKASAGCGWLLEADANASSAGQASVKGARLESASDEAQAIAAGLSGLDSLEKVVLGLAGWAEKQLGVRITKPEPTAPSGQAAFDPLSYEQQNVHAIYETIAPHFSSTRYKPWPLVPAFLCTVPAGSLGADLGCGNGKYLPLRSTLGLTASSSTEDQEGNSLLTVGVDRSSNLVGLARDNFGMLEGSRAQESSEAKGTRRQEVAVGDAIQSSLRTGLFDYAISIATIHHFSTWERRRASVQELIRIIAPVAADSHADASAEDAKEVDSRLHGSYGRGRFMIFVWALEQKDEGKRQFEAPNPESLKSRPEIHDPLRNKAKERLVSYSGLQASAQPCEPVPHADEAEASADQVRVTDDQDVLVPWVLTTPGQKASKKPKAPRASKAKTRKDGAAAGVDTRSLESRVSELSVGDSSTSTEQPAKEADESRPVYNRYYHMFRAGELERLVADAAESMPAVHRKDSQPRTIRVLREAGGWERGNWWGVWRVQWAE